MDTKVLLLCFLASFEAAVHRIDVTWDAIYPVSAYIQPGDVLTFFGTNPAEAHWIVTVVPDFSAPNLTGPINSGVQSGVFEWNVTLVEDHSQGFVWVDLLNPDTSGFGIAYIARSNDVFIQWTVFKTHPPALSNFALDDKYPFTTTIRVGQRVVWNSTLESHLNHEVLFTNRRFQASIGCPFAHPWVSNRNFMYFAWTYDTIGSYNFICAVHASMKGTVKVCSANGNCPSLSNVVRVCPYVTNDNDNENDD